MSLVLLPAREAWNAISRPVPLAINTLLSPEETSPMWVFASQHRPGPGHQSASAVVVVDDGWVPGLVVV